MAETKMVLQTILCRRASLAVVAAGILVAAILLLITPSARAVVPEEHAASAPNDAPIVKDPGAISGAELKDPGPVRGREFAPGQVIVKFRENASPGARANVRSQVGLKKGKALGLIKAEVAKVEGRSVEDAVRALERRPEVQYAQPNFKYFPADFVDEPRFGELWGLNNTGQNGGTPDVDINGLEASGETQGDTNLVVAVIDDGVDFSHPDLAGRAWTNPGEVPNNDLDDDTNGYVDDVNGWDFFYGDKSVHDPGEDWHGTHVSGTLAASVNGQGVVGVAPNVKIMALKFAGPGGGSTSGAIQALAYAKAEGAKISNNSWGSSSYDQALYDAINNSDSLFVAAAGNEGNNYPFYPASYALPNILSVAAADNQGKLASFSNYGATSVDISAPGVGILSSVPGIPEIPAATLSSVGPSGKALTAGFGADEIGESAKRTSFFTKAFTAVDRGSQQVVLVDDDASDSWLRFPDVGPTVSAAIEGATGSAPQVIEVPYRSDGPALSQLSGKTVVWATGQAFLSDDGDGFITNTTLTPTDQATLTDFLEGGGKLIITGMNALYLIEGSQFVRSTLDLDVVSLVGGASFSGASGTAFDGEVYTFNSPTAIAAYHAKVAPATSAAASQGSYPEVPPRWQSWSGTSMATPHATGAAALVASVEPALLDNPVGLKNRIMNGKPLLAGAGKTVSGDMVDAMKALNPPADTTAPTVSGVTPTEGATDADTITNVVATFSEAMDAASVTAPANFTLRKEACATTVPATPSYDSANKKATLVPDAPLDAASTYTVTVSGAWDLAGNQLDQDPGASGDQPKTWSFTTAAGAPPDTSSHNVWAWGGNGSGQLGDCTTTNRTVPVQVSDLSGVTDVAGGYQHSLALKDDGTVWAWGWNEYGQLGDGSTTDRMTPVKVSDLSGVIDVAGGGIHSLALKDDGTVWAWGGNLSGQLGDGTTTERTTPVRVSGLTGVTDVAGGLEHSLAVKDDGTVWAWGENEFGELGDGSTPGTPTSFHTTPVQVGGLSGVTDVAGGGKHSLAMRDDGTVWAWGWNEDGQLGNGTTTDRTTPVQVVKDDGTGGLSSIKDVAGGTKHSLALKDDGTVWAWGHNGYGQLGVGYNSCGCSTTAVQVRADLFWPPEFLSGVVDVSAGDYHSLALKDDGTVWTWGSTYGPDNNTSPVQVSGLSSITHVAGGTRHNLAVSTTAPFTSITSGPRGLTNDNAPTFTFSGSDDVTTTANLKYQYRLDSGGWSTASTSTTANLTGLSDGAHLFEVRALDEAGNVDASPAQRSFTVDTTAPKVDSVVPAEDARRVAPEVNVTATFSEEMQVSSINANTFKLIRKGSTRRLAALVSYDESTHTATLDPSNPLKSGATYKAVVSTRAKDLAGNSLDQNPNLRDSQQKVWFFKVSS